jgi:hypothetical protein
MRDATSRIRFRRAEATWGVAFFLVAIVVGVAGAILWLVVGIIGAALHPWVSITATCLLVGTIPLILCAGYFLDWSESGRNQQDLNHTDQRPNLLPRSDKYKEW